MSGPRPIIRQATIHDADRITAIYGYHVRVGTASFELEEPTVAETSAKISRLANHDWPFLVVEVACEVVGYAYVVQFRPRPAYAYTCENSIYIDDRHRGRGYGKLLLAALCEAAEEKGFRQMLAIVGGGEPSSVKLHAAAGFEHCGRMIAVGWKKGRWLDTVCMQKALGSGSATVPRSLGL